MHILWLRPLGEQGEHSGSIHRPKALPVANLHWPPLAGPSGFGCISPSAQSSMGSELCVLVIASVISLLLEPWLGVSG